jgi:adenylylsulfate kinase
MEKPTDLMESGWVFWLFGLSGAGKTSLSVKCAERIRAAGKPVLILDGDVLRQGVCRGLGFSDEDRRENVRRTAEIARVAADSSINVIVALITPHVAMRAMARQIVGSRRFSEIFVDAPIAECRRRDVKGLYASAERGEIAQFTGLTSSFERPISPDFVIETGMESLETSVDRLSLYLFRQLERHDGYLAETPPERA